MKKLLFTLSLLPLFAFAGELKIGTVDTLVLLRNHPRYESDQTLLKNTEKDYAKDIEKLQKEIKSIEDEGRKLAEQMQSPLLAPAAKQKLEKELSDVQNRYLAAQQRLRTSAMTSQEALRKMENQILKATSESIKEKVSAFAEKNGYDLVLDRSAAPYAKSALDVTDGVLKEMGVDPANAKKGDDESK